MASEIFAESLRNDEMKLESVGEIIAERKLVLLHDLEESEVIIVLGKPQVFPPVELQKSTGYFCPYQIKGLSDEAVRFAGGVDGVRAIELAMKIIGTRLDVELRDRPGTRLVWGAEDPDDAQFAWPYRNPA